MVSLVAVQKTCGPDRERRGLYSTGHFCSYDDADRGTRSEKNRPRPRASGAWEKKDRDSEKTFVTRNACAALHKKGGARDQRDEKKITGR